MTALDLHWQYLDGAACRRPAPAASPTPRPPNGGDDALGGRARRASVATSCRALGDARLGTKLQLLEGFRGRDGLAWDDHRLAAVDIQWADVRPEKGLVHRLFATGAARSTS